MNKFIAKTLVFFLILINLSNINVFAYNDLSIESLYPLSSNSIIESLNDLDFGIDVNFSTIISNPFARNNEHLLSFDSIEEFQEFFEKLILSLQETNNIVIPLDEVELIKGLDSEIISRSLINSSVTWNGASSPWGGLFHNRHIGFSFTRDSSGRVNSATVTNSWITGVSGLSWTHRYGNVTHMFPLIGNIIVEANGTWLLGVSINGFNIGATWSDTWTRGVEGLNR
ncbi:MAG: hypothetical protein FWF57_06125 [Defluviitaleaceae bacterium]|nr:hypothetical protein [Defluviitaleaceae bacterium]